MLAEFLRGQISVMVLMSVLYVCGLWLAGLEFALPIGVITGMLVFVPYVGVLTGLLLATVAGLMQFPSIGAVVPVWIVFAVGQTLEASLVTPFLVGKRIGLHPVAVIFALLAFGQIFGFFGVLLALPASAALLVGLRHLGRHYLNSSLYKVMQQLLLQLAPPPAPTLDNFVPAAQRRRTAGAARYRRRHGRRALHLPVGRTGQRPHPPAARPRAGGARRQGAVSSASAADLGIAEGRLIAVDDVQHLAADDQIRLFDLYNRMRAGAGSLVASGDAAPAQLALRADLRSRLAWGLAFQLHPLSDAEKAAALREHARARAFALGEDVIAYLLRHARRDMASLIGILDALDRYSLEHKRAVTLPLVRDALEAMKDKSA